MPSKGNVAGLFTAQFYKRYNGRAYGQIADPSAPGVNITTHAYRLTDPIRCTLPAVQRAIAEFVGGRGILGRMMLGVESLGNFEAEFANLDGPLMSMANVSNIDTTTVVNWSMFGPNHANPVLQNLGMLLTGRFQDRTLGTDGEFYYITVLVPSIEMEVDLTSLTREGGKNPSPSKAIISPSFAGKFPNGQAFDSTQGFYENTTDYLYIIAAKPIALTTYIANGVATTYTLGFKPTSSAVALGHTDNWFTKGSVDTPPTSISTTTSIVTLAAAGVSGDLHDALYLTDFLPAA
jgi:hypothetical protein